LKLQVVHCEWGLKGRRSVVFEATLNILMQVHEVVKSITPQQQRVAQLKSQLDQAKLAQKRAKLAQQQIKLNQQRAALIK
jgi:hypothetical protein